MKKTFKRVLIVLMLVSLLAITAVTAFAAEEEGITFSSSKSADKWHARKPLSDAPYSFEAWIKVSSSISDETRVGYLFSNYDGGSGTNTYYGNSNYGNRTISLEILAGGYPQLIFGPDNGSGALGSRATIKFDQVDVRTGEWIHLAIVKEPTRVVCYVNGEEKQAIANSQSYYKDDLLQPYALGADNRSSNSYYFRGAVKGLTVYKDVRTAEEVASSYTYGVKLSDVNMLLHYDLTKAPEGNIIEDLTGNGYDMKKKAYDNYVPSADDIGAKGTGTLGSGAVEDGASYDYSFAVVGDTQYITSWDTAYIDGVKNENTHLDILYDWILANKDKKNIKYVMGLGDITDKYDVKYNGSTSGASHDTAAEWAWAYSQISRLDGEIPYSVVRGNHDNENYFDQYFVNDAYRSQFQDPDYKDNSVCFFEDGSVRNAYTKFTVGTEKYLLLLLDYAPTDAALDWAYGVVQRNKDYRVIINTHSYLDKDKTLTDEGDAIWEKVVMDNENVILVLCGHIISSDIVKTEREGNSENAVTEILINPQSRDGQYKYDTKAGMVAMLYFSNGGKDVRVEYISTVKSTAEEDSYANASVNNFDFKLMNTFFETKYGRMTSEYADASKYPFAVFSKDGTFLGAYESLLDCTSSYDNDGAVYRAKNHLSANVWSEGSYGDDPNVAIIWMRSDYALTTNETYNNLAQTKGTMIIDLDGHTLTVSDSKALFPSTIKPWGSEHEYTSHFEAKNGTIILGAKQLISFSASNGTNNLDVSNKKYIHSFTNVKIVASSNTTNLLAGYSSSVAANPEVIFNDCIFDLSEAPSGITLFNLGNGAINTNVTVNGGEFILNGNDLVLSKNGTDTNKLTFGKTENENYTAFTVIGGAELPIESVNDGELAFVKIAEGENGTTYRLRPAEVSDISYVPKMSITLASDFVMNVYIPTNYTQEFTFDGVTYNTSNDFGGKIAELEDGKYYHISLPVGSSEAARELKLVAGVKVGEVSAAATFTFSIPKYAAKVLTSSASETEKTLISDVLLYIKAAYEYFDEHNTDEEKARVSALIDSIVGDYTSAPESSGAVTSDPAVSGVTLILGAKPAIRFYVSDPSVEFYANGKKLKTVSGTDSEGTYLDLEVYAYALCETITYGDSGSYHISDFLTGAAGTAHEDLVACFIRYTESAAKYRG